MEQCMASRKKARSKQAAAGARSKKKATPTTQRKASRRATAERDRTAPRASEPVAPPTAHGTSESLVNAFLVNERMNQLLLDLIAPHIWQVFPACSRRRNIATSFAHIHNVRCMRLRMSRKDVAPPERLERDAVTVNEARKALAESAQAMVALIRIASEAGGRVPNARTDVVGVTCAAIVHEAHHRGQIAHWARELGEPISPEDALRLWEWDRLERRLAPVQPS